MFSFLDVAVGGSLKKLLIKNIIKKRKKIKKVIDKIIIELLNVAVGGSGSIKKGEQLFPERRGNEASRSSLERHAKTKVGERGGATRP